MTLHAAGGGAGGGGGLWAAAWPGPIALAALLLLAALYVRGLRALGSGGRRAVPRARRVAVVAGVATLAAALASPVEGLAEELLSVHMAQHVVLMSLAAPLLVLGSPAVVLARGLPGGLRRRVASAARPLLRARPSRRAAATPFAALLASAAGLWAWHVPVAYEAAVRHEALHVAQHATFLATAIFFWWSVVGAGARAGPGPPIVACVLAALQSTALGVLMTFSPDLWYPLYGEAAPAGGLAPLEDQRVAGTIMWIPGGFVYAGAACLVITRALRSRPRARPARA